MTDPKREPLDILEQTARAAIELPDDGLVRHDFRKAASAETVLALVARIRELETALGDAWELTNKADAALCEIISERQRTLEIPSSPAWRDTPIGKARLMVTEADDVIRAALRGSVGK